MDEHTPLCAAAVFAERIFSAQAAASAWVRQLAFDCFQAAADGHSCLDASGYPCAQAMALPELFAGNRLVAVAQLPGQETAPCLLVVFRDRLYLKKYWLMENRLLGHIAKRCNDIVPDGSAAVSHRLAYSCLEKPLTLLTGGPGTGKTSAISAALVEWIILFQRRHRRIPRIRLCAPTGKAASRMNDAWQRQKPALMRALDAVQSNALPESAQTLHRLLAIHPITRASRYTPEQPLEADLVVFDEASMIDLPTVLQLFDAVPDSCHLLLVGDPEQLPSIEIGSVLQALLSLPESSRLQRRLGSAHIRLQHNFRQSDAPGLSALASDIMQREPSDVLARMAGDFYTDVSFRGNNASDLAELVESAVSHYQSMAAQPHAELALDMLNQRMLLSPVREGRCGSVTLNARIGNRLHAHGNRHGQVLMITENVPSLGLANGDIGLVWRQADGFNVHFKLHGGMQILPLASVPRHEPAYALTVHKAQGSEFDHVDLVLPDADTPLLTRALIYTACTRARHSLALFAQAEMLSGGLRRQERRTSGLAVLAGST